MSFSRADRQAIIDGYLQESGANQFVPGEFVDWLSGHPEHEAYEWFFGQGDEAAAREYRIDLARKMASGLRIVSSAPAVAQVKLLGVEVREFPAMVSPVAGRKEGGGYVAFSPNDPAMVDELRRQGAQALRSWLARYGGVSELAGVDLEPLEEIAAHLEGRVVDAA